MITQTQISVNGKFRTVQALLTKDATVIFTGGYIRTASIKDEFWIDEETTKNPKELIETIKGAGIKADILRITQKLPDTSPKYDFPWKPSSVAAIPLISYQDWWENRVTQVTRKNVRRAARKGTIVNKVDFSDQLVHGIVEINNETPSRQGRPFWHYGKSHDVVKRDYSDLLDSSEFFGAYYGGYLIGILRLIYTRTSANIIQLLCMNKHFDKRPSNALISSAVEAAIARKCKFLTYGQYIYNKNVDSPLTEFKRRNGFVEFLLPSYFISLSLKGSIIINSNLQNGIRPLIPLPFMRFARKIRTKLQMKGKSKSSEFSEISNEDDN